MFPITCHEFQQVNVAHRYNVQLTATTVFSLNSDTHLLPVSDILYTRHFEKAANLNNFVKESRGYNSCHDSFDVLISWIKK